MSNTVDYSKIKVNYAQTDVDSNLRGGMPAPGWYRLTVASAESKVSEKKGSMMFQLGCLVTDAERNTRGKPILNFLVLPMSTPTELLKAAGFPETFKHTAPNTAGLVRSYLEATKPEQFPHELTYAKTERQWYFKGNAISKDEADSIKRDGANKLLAFVTDAWTNPEGTFLGDTFYARVEYQDGRDLPSIASVRATLPEGETLVIA